MINDCIATPRCRHRRGGEQDRDDGPVPELAACGEDAQDEAELLAHAEREAADAASRDILHQSTMPRPTLVGGGERGA